MVKIYIVVKHFFMMESLVTNLLSQKCPKSNFLGKYKINIVDLLKCNKCNQENGVAILRKT